MAIDIVSKIISGGKGIITAELPDQKQLDYEYDLEENSDKNKEKGFGLIISEGDAGASRLGHVTVNQTFQVILTTRFFNRDDEVQQRTAIDRVYLEMHCLLKVFIRSKMGVTPSSDGCVDLVAFNSFEPLEFIDDNTTVVLRLNLLVSYRYLA